ncbi:B domain of TMEM189 domain-containing protein [Chloropicon primus]|uniref:Lipid desaturase domain-containing protein n=1 Tax=Chloropicon primus TaxID=1764295 RepID=A0A5B8MWA0_9CHLO|nr:hypothetical protein A3770_14p73370 [Chloropicon primus]UPR04028.1 B domain of TMEM189 domain-containing protein [Chloropicon primus]|eukprot:QDZ24819.1 hypothetical protein A3770_14p73370 [Chloropicon primus]
MGMGVNSVDGGRRGVCGGGIASRRLCKGNVVGKRVQNKWLRTRTRAEVMVSEVEEKSLSLSREEKRRMRMEGNTNFIIENDGFKSTGSQRVICAASFGLTGLCVAEALSTVDSAGDASAMALSALAAWVLSDLGSGIFHWSVDNYGSGKTPILGNVIAAFQGHHGEPWTITMREFSNNTYKTCIPTLPFLVLCATDVDHPEWQMFWSLFSAFICLAQQFHSWSHMKKQELPFLVNDLQEAGLLISRKAHSSHHREPFENNYCIVSGLCNDALDGSGVLQFLEKKIFEATGVEPRCWIEEQDMLRDTMRDSLQQ